MNNLIAFKEKLIPRLLLVCCSVGEKIKAYSFFQMETGSFLLNLKHKKKKVIILTHNIITEQEPPVTSD